jgi:protein TonB
MAPFGKSLCSSLFLHGAMLLVAAAVAANRLGDGKKRERDSEPWGEPLVAAMAGEQPPANSINDPAPATPPEPERGAQSADLLPPAFAIDKIPPTPPSAIMTTSPVPFAASEPPPTLAKKSGRKSPPMPAAATRGGASRAADGAGGNSAGAYIPARYSRCPAPIFPAEARKSKISGTVLLLVEVDENGRPSQVTLRRSSGNEILDNAALRAVRNWRFEPARSEGRPIRARVEVPVRFALS